MTSLIKTSIPYVLMIGLMVLTLCTRGGDQTASSEVEKKETVDSLSGVAQTRSQ